MGGVSGSQAEPHSYVVGDAFVVIFENAISHPASLVSLEAKKNICCL
jgi:hypothetical protein